VDSYNPYLHGPSKGEYVRSLIESNLPPALVAPELIKVSAIPTKKVYDFTKRSQNAKYLEEGALDRI
jgi:hypothetical protein